MEKGSEKKKKILILFTGGTIGSVKVYDEVLGKNIIMQPTEAKEKYGDKISYLPYGTRKKLIRYIFVYTYLCLKTIYLYFKIRPKYIVTTGTHTAGPMCYLGKLFGSKIIYIETFANRNRKTATGRLIYPIADLFIVQWEEMLKLYPKAVYGGAIY